MWSPVELPSSSLTFENNTFQRRLLHYSQQPRPRPLLQWPWARHSTGIFNRLVFLLRFAVLNCVKVRKRMFLFSQSYLIFFFNIKEENGGLKVIAWDKLGHVNVSDVVRRGWDESTEPEVPGWPRCCFWFPSAGGQVDLFKPQQRGKRTNSGDLK